MNFYFFFFFQRSKEQRPWHTLLFFFFFFFWFLFIYFPFFFLAKEEAVNKATYYALLLQFQWPPRAPWLLIHLGHTRIALIHQINNIKHCIGRTAPPTTRKTRKKNVKDRAKRPIKLLKTSPTTKRRKIDKWVRPKPSMQY